MKRISWKVWGLTFLISSAAGAQGWRVSAGGAYLFPVAGLSNRFRPQVAFAVGMGKQRDERWYWGGRVDIIRFTNQNRERLYAKNLQLELEIYGGALEGRYGLTSFRRQLYPYLLGSAGVYRWFSTRGAYHDSTVTLREFKQQDWSWGFSGGAGLDYAILHSLALSVEARYQMVVGELWPALAVRLENVSTFQWVSVNAGVRISF